jgi:hypothetical protein
MKQGIEEEEAEAEESMKTCQAVYVQINHS